jgi:Ca2+-binding EF-hand superfamily protein
MANKSPKLRFTAAPTKIIDSQEQILEEVFNAMDVDCNQRVNKAEFKAYLKKNPTGWPLADVLAGQTDDVKEQIINFWFRKLDLESSGSFDKFELIAFFKAMKQTKYKEMLYADFLLNLFDRNYDGKLDRDEYANMLQVLLGRNVPTYVLSSVATDGLSRDDLVSLLHTIHCDFSQLDSRNTAKNAGALDFAMLGVAVGAAVVATAVVLSFLRR